MAEPEQPIIALRDIDRSFPSALGQRVEILKGLSLDIMPGSFTVIRGESGSGKTTLLRILGMLDSGFSGEYLFAEHRIEHRPDWFLDEIRAENIGFIFQEGRLFGHLTLRKNIEIPLLLLGDRRLRAGSIVEELAPRFFEDDRRDEILDLRPGPASGGQKQRASIMRAIISRPCVILADEPTASLHGDLKQSVVEHLQQLCQEGHTVIVVSHDLVFHSVGRQLELVEGELRPAREPSVPQAARNPHDPQSGCEAPWKARLRALKRPLADAARKPHFRSSSRAGSGRPPNRAPSEHLPVRSPASPLFWGWRPRAPISILFKQAIRETISRPIFLGLILVSLIVGVCQVSVFASVIVGAQQFVDDAMTKGSRLNRIEIKPRRQDRANPDRFPSRGEIAAWPSIAETAPRRITLASLVDRAGEANTYSAMGLHPGDPEYGLLDFVAGGPFTGSHDQLEVIVTVGLLGELFDLAELESGRSDYADFIGRPVSIVLRQYTPSGEVRSEAAVNLKLQGIILYAEGGRQLYLPNTTHLAFDRYKKDRLDEFPLPINEAGTAWTDMGAVNAMADFPWEDTLQVYVAGMRDVIPAIRDLAKLGYKPESDIWRYKWVLDVQDTAWRIFVPLLALIVIAVAITVAANIFTSAKLRETELALWRVLGMRRGDLILTQVLATAFSVTLGTLGGLALGSLLVEQSKQLLAERGAEATVQGGAEAQGFDAIFAPVSEFYVLIFATALLLGIFSALYPAFRTAQTDPAKVLQS
jgi:ABC-type lipoprotein export system ATPase subunit